MKKALITLAAGLSLVLIPVLSAVTATGTECGDWQRYSWTGGPHEPDSPPVFPSDNWQANVKGDPHGIGQEGAYYRSNANSGKGDWFYLDWIEVDCPRPDPEPTTNPPVVDPPVDNPPPVTPPVNPPVDVPPVVLPPTPPGVTVHPFADGYNHPSPVELG